MLPSVKELLAFGRHVLPPPRPYAAPLAAAPSTDPAAAKQRPGRKAGSNDRYSAPPGVRQYRCGVHSCAALFKRPEHLKRHMLTHTQVRPYRCGVQGCGKSFSRRDNYSTHAKKHEAEPDGLLDGSPGLSSAQSSRHSSPQRSTPTDSPCTPPAKRICQYPPRLQPLDMLAYASLQAHAPSLGISAPPSPSSPLIPASASADAGSPQRSPTAVASPTEATAMVDDPTKPFACSLCDSRFGRMEHVKRHQLVHTGERQYECPVCTKPFARKDNMLQHQRAHQRPAGSLGTSSTSALLY
ncbi:hypothetical protein H4R19_002444 [Coemansia spiralis]|nr:hypothetical protein H4R19_002444 [Coemansia spiralis]